MARVRTSRSRALSPESTTMPNPASLRKGDLGGLREAPPSTIRTLPPAPQKFRADELHRAVMRRDAYNVAVRARLTPPLPPRLDASAFPVATPLNAFFAWNEARYVRDRRYIIARDIYRLLQKFSGDTEICLAHLLGQPVSRWRFGLRVIGSATRLRAARAGIER